MDIPENDVEKFEQHRAELLKNGYTQVDEYKVYREGVRVRGRSARYFEALEKGTGTVLAVFHKPNSQWAQDWHMEDVEMIILNDKPWSEGMTRLAVQAQYHVTKVDIY